MERVTINTGWKAMPRPHPAKPSSPVFFSRLWFTRQRRCCAVAEVGPRVVLPPASLPSRDMLVWRLFNAANGCQ